MIIVLHGENTFFSKRKLDEIIVSYRAKHKSGLSFFVFDADRPDSRFDFADFKSAVETVSMFSERKLIVVKNALEQIPFEYLREKKLKEDADAVIVFCEESALGDKKDKEIKWLMEKPAIVQESKNFEGAKLRAWIAHEVRQKGGVISGRAADRLAAFCGPDFWRLSNEIEKLLCYGRNIGEKEVELLVSQNVEADVFEAVSYLAARDAKKSLHCFYRLIRRGGDPLKIFGLVVYQFRVMIKIKSAGLPYDQLAKKARLHPFVVKKNTPLARGYSLEELLSVYRRLLEADLELKRGGMSFEEVLQGLIFH